VGYRRSLLANRLVDQTVRFAYQPLPAAER